MKQKAKFNVVYQNEDGSIEWVVGIGKVEIPKGAVVMEKNLMGFVDIPSDTPDIEEYTKAIKRNKFLTGVLYYLRVGVPLQKYLSILGEVEKDPDGVMK